MIRRPSIELTNLQCYGPPSSEELTPEDPPMPSSQLSRLNYLKVNADGSANLKKQQLRRSIMAQVRETSKKPGYPKSEKEALETLGFPMLIQHIEMQFDGEEKKVILGKSNSVPAHMARTMNRMATSAFRIHHKSLTKYVPPLNKFQKAPLQLSQKSSKVKTRQYLKIEGVHLQGRGESDHWGNEKTRTEQVEPLKFSEGERRVARSKTIQNEKKPFQLSESKGNKELKEIDELVYQARKKCQEKQLFKLPKEKAILLQMKLREAIKSDIDQKKQNKENLKKLDKLGLSIPKTKTGTPEEKVNRKGTLPWRKKRDDELTILKGRMQQKKLKLQLR